MCETIDRQPTDPHKRGQSHMPEEQCKSDPCECGGHISEPGDIQKSDPYKRRGRICERNNANLTPAYAGVP